MAELLVSGDVGWGCSHAKPWLGLEDPLHKRLTRWLTGCSGRWWEISIPHYLDLFHSLLECPYNMAAASLQTSDVEE